MTQDELKMAVAKAAISYVKAGSMIGVGTGSTANFFIAELAKMKGKIDAAVASSKATEDRLRAAGIPIVDLNAVDALELYIDGADEFNLHRHLVKGGGGALTREKIVAAVAKSFICIVDISKKVDVLGKFPLPVEVIPMARSYVARELVKLGGQPVYRQNVVTDNGNVILDVKNFSIVNPPELETAINQITGVVTNGLFARRKADVVLIASPGGMETLSA